MFARGPSVSARSTADVDMSELVTSSSFHPPGSESAGAAPRYTASEYPSAKFRIEVTTKNVITATYPDAGTNEAAATSPACVEMRLVLHAMKPST
jgi:hypothetical protein